MSVIDDRKLKTINVNYYKSGTLKKVQLIEQDKVDIIFYDVLQGKTLHIETGLIIKIGIANEIPYLILVPYDFYLEPPIYYVPIVNIRDVINVNRGSVYAISPVYSPDESVAALKSDGDHLLFTTNGKDWKVCAGGGGGGGVTIEEVDQEIERYLESYYTKEQIDELLENIVPEDRIREIATEVAGEVVDNKLDDYFTKEEVTERIEQAVSTFITENDAKTLATEIVDEKLEDYDTSEQVTEKINSAIEDLPDKQYVKDKIDEELEDYDTSFEVTGKIEEATSPLAPKADPTFTGTVTVPTVTPETNDGTAASTAYVTNAVSTVKQELAGALHFKGVVDTYDELLAIEDPGEGDVYQVRESEAGTNAEFVWVVQTESWVELGTNIDLSIYMTKYDATIALQQNLAQAKAYTDEKVADIDLYALCVEKGYLGTKEQFCIALADLCNHVLVIPTVDDQVP